MVLEPGFDALCVDHAAAARKAPAGTDDHICQTHDASYIVSLGELLGRYGGETAVDGGIHGAIANEVTDALLK